MGPGFSVSLMCMDYLAIREQLGILNQRATMYHIDIMDGHFCPNLALTPDLMRAFRQVATLPMDAHLMTTSPGDWIDRVAEAGAATISLPREAIDTNAFRLLGRIESLGCKSGLVLCPATPLAQAEHLLERLDILTIMTVDVGYAGQAFIPQMLRKMAQAREWKEKHGARFIIQIDGACNRQNFGAMRRHGAEQFILGSALFGKSGDINEAYSQVMDDYTQATGEELP